MTVRPSLTSAPKPMLISLKREPWMKVPLVDSLSRTITSSPESSALM